MNAPKKDDLEIVTEREFAAPRELVWTAFTDPKHVDKWWGPNGFRNETISMDFRVGGTWRYIMHGPDGKPWTNWIRYEKIEKPSFLSYAHGGAEDEMVFKNSVTFTEANGRTKLTMRAILPSAEAMAEAKKYGAVEGGRQTLARLDGFLPHLSDGTANTGVVVTRVYDAPVKLVFQAWSDPKMLVRWFGPKNYTLPICEVDFRTGGTYRMMMRGPDGDNAFHGEYLEVIPEKRLVFTGVMDGITSGPIVTTVSFDVEADGKTRLTVHQVTPEPKEMAEGQMQSWSETLERLAEAIR